MSEKPPVGELIFLNEGGVMVTTARLVVPGGHTFAVAGITSVRPGRETNGQALAMRIIALVLLFVPCPGSAAVAFALQSSGAGLLSFMFLGLSLMFATGSLFTPDRRCLTVAGAGGRQNVLVGADPGLIDRVAGAVNQAIVARS